MKILTVFSLITVFFLTVLSGPVLSESNQNSWRCGDNVISLGDSKSSVLFKCGPPTTRDIIESTTEGSFISKERGDKSRGHYEDTTVVTEEWAYNCGSYKFNTFLIFKGGRLKSIIRGEYGSGKSYCEGAENNPNNKKQD